MNELFELVAKLEKLIPKEEATSSIHGSLRIFKAKCEQDLRVLARGLWVDVMKILEPEVALMKGKLAGDVTETYNDCYFRSVQSGMYASFQIDS